MEISEGRVTANGVEFAYLECGSGPLALCLHGFPDCAWTWRHLLPALGDAGFHAVAPWMRGYAPTAVPADGHYQSGALVADACALHEALGAGDDAVLIGHDWGARAANGAAAHAQARWRRVVTLAVPPPPVLAQAFFNYDQLRRSWYMFFFLHPFADMVVPMNDLEFIDRLWAEWSPGYAAAGDLAAVKDSLRDPANLSAALGYYRATLDPTRQVAELAEHEAAVMAMPPQPQLYLHGVDDGCMGVELGSMAESVLTAPGSKVEIVDGTGHFLHLEAPELVNRAIVKFVTET